MSDMDIERAKAIVKIDEIQRDREAFIEEWEGYYRMDKAFIRLSVVHSYTAAASRGDGSRQGCLYFHIDETDIKYLANRKIEKFDMEMERLRAVADA